MGSCCTRVEHGVGTRKYVPIPLTQFASPDEVAALARSLQGTLTFPNDIRYDHARRAWNLDTVGFPSAVATVASEGDVATVVRFAAKHGILLGVCSAGRHSMFASVDDSLLCDLSNMRHVAVDPKTRLVRFGGGCYLGDVDRATQPHGLAVVVGHHPFTGVGGLVLGGGFGILQRTLGLTVDSLVSCRVVLPSGEVVVASEDSHSDLFWALRGGGGNFGVVVEYTCRGTPVPQRMYAGFQVYPAKPLCKCLGSRGIEGFRGHRDLWENMPREMGGGGVILGGGPFAGYYCYNGPVAEGRRLVQTPWWKSVRALRCIGHEWLYCSCCVLRALTCRSSVQAGKPTLSLMKPRLYHTEAQRLSWGPLGRESQAGYYYERGVMLDKMSDAAVDIVWRYTHEKGLYPTAGGANLQIGIILCGGAVADVGATQTAFPARKAKLWLIIMAQWKRPHARAACVAWAKALHAALKPHSLQDQVAVISHDAGTSQAPNLLALSRSRLQLSQSRDRIEEAKRMDVVAPSPKAWDVPLQAPTSQPNDVFKENLARLRAVKARYDPGNLFCLNRNLQPALPPTVSTPGADSPGKALRQPVLGGRIVVAGAADDVVGVVARRALAVKDAVYNPWESEEAHLRAVNVHSGSFRNSSGGLSVRMAGDLSGRSLVPPCVATVGGDDEGEFASPSKLGDEGGALALRGSCASTPSKAGTRYAVQVVGAKECA